MPSCTFCRSISGVSSLAGGTTHKEMPGAVLKYSYPHPKEQSYAPDPHGGSGSCGTEKNGTNTPEITDEVELDAIILCGLHRAGDYVR